MDFAASHEPACFLVDNGSLRPAATRMLRRIARDLAARISRPVEAVSLLHSDRIPPGELDGTPAEIFAEAVRRRYHAGVRQVLVVPLFFGPSAALTEYLPARSAALAKELGSLEVRVAAPVAGGDPTHPDPRVSRILADHVRGLVAARSLRAPVVVLVDHGSPQRAVGEVRDHVARLLAAELGGNVRAVVAASMERRPGSDYDFNEPLLERALEAPPCGPGAGDVILAPLFFSPGRHAGPDGDIATIAAAAAARHSGLRIHMAPLVGEHPLLLEILADRYRSASAR